MTDLSPARLAWVRLTSWLYGVVFYLTYKRILNLALSLWLQLSLFIVALAAASFGAGRAALALLALLLVVRLILVWVRRRGYKRFIADPKATLPANAPAWPDNQEMAVRATGVFAVTSREAYLLNRSPARYWRTALGEHIFMVEQAPGHFLYQFFRRETLRSVGSGYLIAAGRTQPALAITFAVTFGPEFTDESLRYYVGGGHRRQREKLRTIYVSFHKDDDCFAFWRNVAGDLSSEEAA